MRKGTERYIGFIDDDLVEEKVDEIEKEGFIGYVSDDINKRKHLKSKTWIGNPSAIPTYLKF